MPEFKLESLKISLPPFRKLKNIEINFSERITLIAGHNGIGKSTILGLVANGSGLTDKTYSSYTGRTFQGNLNEIIYLDYDTELANNENPPRPILQYNLDGEQFEKRCALTKRRITATKRKPERLEVRVVPRNVSSEPFTIQSTGETIGESSKVPIPTIYLGMTRMLPIGESNPELIESDTDTTIHDDDATFISQFINEVIGINQAGGQIGITTQGIKGTSKKSKHPIYAHSPKTISLGQDSLSAIATALASFKKLQREWSDYPGGLLVIDEIDAGFHPHAQRKLIRKIASCAKSLKLQVVATTHSLPLIESIHPDANPIGGKGVSSDKVIYIWDSNNPSIADIPLQAIKDDMNLTAPTQIRNTPKQKLKVYLEDAEASLFFKTLLTPSLRRRVKNESGRLLNPIPISVGCDNMQGLQRFDPHFKTVIIAVDADSSVRKQGGQYPKNIVKLPGAKDANGKGLNPERTIYNFVEEIVKNSDSHPEAYSALIDLNVTTDQLNEHLLSGDFNILKRESAKKWMKDRLDHINEWKLIELWIKENPEEVERFERDLIAAAVATDMVNI
ncbi:AAA family ATPase [Methylophaga thalassica]|uniref:AAA family ATPase n=1 Tax=Methylophaga thalassica TaxID=40223 RepID=UPI002E7C45E1|nr:AAA family ATPase [Methylophaga thalassica]WVI85661.1 AAA family ATPase [Methylophaga thalassica]